MTTEELRALDVEIHTKVMGLCAEFGRHSEYDVAPELDRHLWEREDWYAVTREPTAPGYNRRCFPVPRYSVEIAATWLVVERLSGAGSRLSLENWSEPDRRWSALFDFPDGHDSGQHVGATASEAICRAALKAVQS